jgi:hypothetical protein
MHITLRRFVFAVFVLTFLISAPLLVLYTAGYRLNISNKRLQQTGVLAISTVPKGTNISINGQNLAQKSPYVIQRIMPNTHAVVFQKKGYHEWSQRVTVEEGKTTYISARLFADSQPTLLTVPEATIALRSRDNANAITVDNASIHFLNNGSNIEVHSGSDTGLLIGLLPMGQYTLLEEDDEFILITDERRNAFVVARQGGAVVQLPAQLTHFDWLPNKHLLIWTDGTEINIYDAPSGENTFITRDGQSITDVAWHPEADSFFIATNTSIAAYDRNVYETREITPLLFSGKIADIWLDPAGKNLYYIAEPMLENANVLPIINRLLLAL